MAATTEMRSASSGRAPARSAMLAPADAPTKAVRPRTSGLATAAVITVTAVSSVRRVSWPSPRPGRSGTRVMKPERARPSASRCTTGSLRRSGCAPVTKTHAGNGPLPAGRVTVTGKPSISCCSILGSAVKPRAAPARPGRSMTIGISAAARARAPRRDWRFVPVSPGAAMLACTRRKYYRVSPTTSGGFRP